MARHTTALNDRARLASAHREGEAPAELRLSRSFALSRRGFTNTDLADITALMMATALLLGGVPACCAPPIKPEVALLSGMPEQQARAAVQVARRGEVQSIPELIALLDDRDPAVRMYAIMALQDLTGQTYGYKFYAPPAERSAAIQRWQQALRSGELGTTRESANSSAPEKPAQ